MLRLLFGKDKDFCEHGGNSAKGKVIWTGINFKICVRFYLETRLAVLTEAGSR